MNINMPENGLEYVCGYIVKKLNLPQYESSNGNFTYVDHLSFIL